MVENVVVEPMTEEFVLWRCLHSGPLGRDTIHQWPADTGIAWAAHSARNVPLLVKLTRTYGACAILARDGEQVVGLLRFYPKAVWGMKGAGELCLQQDAPAGPDPGFAECDFPPLARLQDKTLAVHCLMTGSPQREQNPYQRKRIGTRLVGTLVQWARERGWQQIEATAFEDLPIIYAITGCAGHTFWEKLGFALVDRGPHPSLQGEHEFVRTLESQALAAGIPPERAKDQLLMRLEL